MNSGIYCINCIENNRNYVGQAQDIETRWSQHLKALRSKKHPNRHLQGAFNKYGEDSFFFNIIELCDVVSLDEKEKFYIKKLMAHTTLGGFNVSLGGEAPMRGLKHSEETRRKIGKNPSRLMGNEHPQWGKKHKKSSSKYLGVRKVLYDGKYLHWISQIFTKKQCHHIGSFKTEIDAAKAYNSYVIANGLDRPLNQL